ncbi:MAG: type III pantothenate kinase [Mycoplasmataceae bacterium]|jgi:pantothenate kinase type III|nr:type III pantothenate kinase [Mycoplasmataceae bacterium]
MSILIVDVGNTNIKLGIFINKKLKRVFITPTHHYQLNKSLSKLQISQIYIGSVVPSINKKLSNDLFKLTKVNPQKIKVTNFKAEFNLSKFNQSEIGTDILSLALFIKKTVHKGAGICFGTASYAVAVDNKTMHGAIIAPPIITGIEKLHLSTSMLRQTNMKMKQSFKFGSNTIEALTSGAAYMANGFITGIINYCKKHYGMTHFIITGGKARELELIDKISGATIVDNAILLGYQYLI